MKNNNNKQERLTPSCRLPNLSSIGTIGRITLLFGIALLASILLVGCPDDGGNGGNNGGDGGNNGNGGNNGTPSDATAAQNAAIATVGATTATLTWSAPTDTAGYEGVLISEASSSGNLITPQPVAAGTQSFAITGLEADTSYRVTIQTQYTLSGKNNNRDIDIQTVTNTDIQHITVSGINTTVLTLAWQNPVDTADYTEVMITSEPAAGSITTPQSVAPGTTTFSVTGLTAGTPYRFTFATIYSGDKTGSSTDITAETLTVASIDADGDTRIDITSLERLHNIRYTLDGSRYRTSSTDPGSQCGPDGTTACTGYELTRSLDFTNADSYDGSIANAMHAWRPNSMANSMGRILPQALAADGTNSGWNPIGTTATRFNSRVEGNGHTIHNLYGRRSAAGDLGLFGATGSSSVIRSIGVASVRLYGSDGADFIGALVGDSNGTIVASYASGTINGGRAGIDSVGGLVGNLGTNTAAVVASYAAVSVNSDGGNQVALGGLIGASGAGRSSIIASYASGAVTSAAIQDGVGGLMGSTFAPTIIIASYASGTVNGGDIVGGLISGTSGTSNIIASYSTGTVDGGEGAGIVGSLRGLLVNVIASYGFGTVTGGTGGSDGSARTGGVAGVGTGIAGARTLTLDNAGDQWNQVNTDATPPITTMDAWDFGTAAQAPALRYADYDGTEDTYGCGDNSNATIVIPSVVATPTGPMRITCGTTLLPEQVR